MTTLINALNKLAANSILSIASTSEINKCGKLKCEIKLVSNPAGTYHDGYANLRFSEVDGKTHINANVKNLNLHSESDKNEESLARHEQALALTKLILASQEVKDAFLEEVYQAQAKVNSVRETEQKKLEVDHVKLTKETAQNLLKEITEALQAKQDEAKKKRTRSGDTHEEASVQTKIVHEDGTVEKFSLRVLLKKRISYSIDYRSATKTEMMDHLNGAYISKETPFSVD